MTHRLLEEVEATLTGLDHTVADLDSNTDGVAALSEQVETSLAVLDHTVADLDENGEDLRRQAAETAARHTEEVVANHQAVQRSIKAAVGQPRWEQLCGAVGAAAMLTPEQMRLLYDDQFCKDKSMARRDAAEDLRLAEQHSAIRLQAVQRGRQVRANAGDRILDDLEQEGLRLVVPGGDDMRSSSGVQADALLDRLESAGDKLGALTLSPTGAKTPAHVRSAGSNMWDEAAVRNQRESSGSDTTGPATPLPALHREINREVRSSSPVSDGRSSPSQSFALEAAQNRRCAQILSAAFPARIVSKDR